MISRVLRTNTALITSIRRLPTVQYPCREFHTTLVAHKRSKSGNYFSYGATQKYIDTNITTDGQSNVLITDELFNKDIDEIRPLVRDEIFKIAKQVLGDATDIKTDLKTRFNVLNATMKRMGREIANNALPNIKSLEDLENYFVALIETEKPKPIEKLPDNVKLFMKHEKRQAREQNEEQAFRTLKEKRREAWQLQKELQQQQ
jgi:phage-related tail protein